MSAEQAIDHALGSMDNDGLQELMDLLKAQPQNILPTLRFVPNESVGAKGRLPRHLPEVVEICRRISWRTKSRLWV